MYATGPQVLFEDGKPSRWLFTSKKTGEVMKKTVEHTNHLSIKVRRGGSSGAHTPLTGSAAIHSSVFVVPTYRAR